MAGYFFAYLAILSLINWPERPILITHPMKHIVFFTALLLASAGLRAQDSFQFVFLNSRPDKEELPQAQVDSLMELHFANMGRLAEAGHLLVAGPFYGGGGIFVFGTDEQVTDSLVQTDPAVQANRWHIEQFTWRPHEGGICVAPEDYEMTTYSVLRFYATDQSPTEAQVQEQLTYLKTLEGTILTLGTFDDGAAGVMLVFDGEPNDALAEASPGVMGGWYTGKAMQLYIAEGSFCE